MSSVASLESLAPTARLSLSKAAKTIGVNTSTVWRWAFRGLSDGRKLPTFMLGGRRFVMVEELSRFASPGTEETPPPVPRQHARTRAAAAVRECEARTL